MASASQQLKGREQYDPFTGEGGIPYVDNNSPNITYSSQPSTKITYTINQHYSSTSRTARVLDFGASNTLHLSSPAFSKFRCKTRSQPVNKQEVIYSQELKHNRRSSRLSLLRKQLLALTVKGETDQVCRKNPKKACRIKGS